MEAALTHEEFTKHLNTPFQVHVDEEKSVLLQLTEISEIRVSPLQEQFSIVFRGPLDSFLQQGTRLLSHNEMGEFDLFLVPVKQDAESFHYEAVFNRVRE